MIAIIFSLSVSVLGLSDPPHNQYRPVLSTKFCARNITRYMRRAHQQYRSDELFATYRPNELLKLAELKALQQLRWAQVDAISDDLNFVQYTAQFALDLRDRVRAKQYLEREFLPEDNGKPTVLRGYFERAEDISIQKLLLLAEVLELELKVLGHMSRFQDAAVELGEQRNDPTLPRLSRREEIKMALGYAFFDFDEEEEHFDPTATYEPPRLNPERETQIESKAYRAQATLHLPPPVSQFIEHYLDFKHRNRAPVVPEFEQLIDRLQDI